MKFTIFAAKGTISPQKVTIFAFLLKILHIFSTVVPVTNMGYGVQVLQCQGRQIVNRNIFSAWLISLKWAASPGEQDYSALTVWRPLL